MGEDTAIFKRVDQGWELADPFTLQDGDEVRFLKSSENPVPFHELPTFTVEQSPGKDTYTVNPKE
jgi:hypothetical protein